MLPLYFLDILYPALNILSYSYAMVYKNHSSMTKIPTFDSVLLAFEQWYDLRAAFDDFLTAAICYLSTCPLTRKSFDEDLLLDTIAKYEEHEADHLFPLAFACMCQEMHDRKGTEHGHDVLGDFYQTHLCKEDEQPFHSWKYSQHLAQEAMDAMAGKPMHVVDPNCGSGRVLVASFEQMGSKHGYFGIDANMMHVKMAAINLFLNGVFHGEVMCADAHAPDDFKGSYTFSIFPLGIQIITEKADSTLWQLHRQTREIAENVQKQGFGFRFL